MSRYLIGTDVLVEELLRAQRPPPRWTVFRVELHRAHAFNGHNNNLEWITCRECFLKREAHRPSENLRVVSLLMNGPIRHLTVLTQELDELPKDARNWLNTLYNLAEAANTRLDGWIAYDGRG